MKDLSSLSTKEIYEDLKSNYTKSRDYLLVGKNWQGQEFELEYWKELKPRLKIFLEKSHQIHTTYKRSGYDTALDWYIRTLEDNKNLDLEGVNFGQGNRDCKTMIIIYSYDNYDCTKKEKGILSASIPDFLDPDFEVNYTTRLRDKKLERVTNKINKLMDTLGELIETQQKLQKEKEENI